MSKIIAFLIATALVCAGLVALNILVVRPHQTEQATNVTVENNLAGARTDSAAAAVQTVQQQGQSETTVDQQVKEASNEIHKAPGADVPVTIDVNRAGLRALCMRNAYRDSPRCRAVFKSRP